MPQFELANALPQIVWLAIIFAILYLTLAFGALPKVTRVAERRASRIGEDVAAADVAGSKARETLSAYEASLAEARAAATKVTTDAKDSTARETDARLKALGSSLDAQAAEATQRIEAQRAEASKGLDAIAREAADAIVARLLGRPATARG
jgi:F-type H+-transporting ATPase subunit b